MRLFCISRYSGTVNPDTDEQGRFRVGEEILVPDHVGEFLQRSSPGSFSTKAPGEKKTSAAKAAASFDTEGANVEELKAFAEAEGIELEDGASEEDIRAAIALALEERAKSKVATAETASGQKTNTRPARKGNRR